MEVKDVSSKIKQFVTNRAGNTRKKQKILLGCFLTGAFALAATNPSEEAYLAYASSRLPARAEEACDKIGPGVDIQLFILKVPAGSMCKSIISGSGKLLNPFSKRYIDSRTEDPMNFVLFSIYTTDLPGIRPFRTVGIGHQFIGLPW